MAKGPAAGNVMGIYDRDYYRKEGPSFLGTITRWGQVCKWLIIINIIAYVIQLLTRQQVHVEFARELGIRPPMGPSPFTEWLLLNVPDVLTGQVWRLLTYAFLHSPDNLWHIVFNMLFLWWFGTEVEDIYGHKEFLAFYLFGALAGGAGFTLGYLTNLNGSGCYGASGAVTAIMVLYACHFPSRIIYFFGIVPIPIWAFVGFQVVQDIFGLLGGRNDSNVAFMGHLGGAAFGFLYYQWGGRVLNLIPDFQGWARQRNRPKLRIYRDEAGLADPEPVPTPAGAEIDEQLEAKLDAVLVKVQRFGMNSLTEAERQILLKGSEVYKKKRS